MPELVQQIEAILDPKRKLKLRLAPDHDATPSGALPPVMRVLDKQPQYALDSAGNITGLNLASTGLTDKKWQDILDLLPGSGAHLTALHLGENGLTAFPFPEGDGLRKLERLNLAENKLKEFLLPKGMDGLTDLELEENPLESPPPDVVALGKAEILKWLRDEGKKPVREAKVMFIGDSNYGKTHLIEMLLHKAITRKIDTTHGIERCQMEDAPSDQGPIRLNVWDLGGQQFMRSTHQFFFTERTLYVLVTVARRERKDLNHWLQLVHEIGGDAPVLVVINKTDGDEHDIDREPLQREYPNIKGFVRTAVFDNSEKGVVALDTIQELQSKIHKIVADKKEMPSVFVEQRPEWFTVKEELEKMKGDYISYEKYCQLEHIKSLPDDEKRLNLKQLASLGTVVSFVDDPRLDHTHVINPQWIMDGVYNLINDAEVKDKRRGEFSFADLKRLLPIDRYPSDKYSFLVELMEKFKLCYPLRTHKNTFLLPDLFSDIEPAGVWPEQNKGLQLRFNYDSFPPALFMAQFIVERYADIVDEKRWRNGVVVRHGRCEAIVRHTISKEHIEIEVIGPEKQRRGYLHELLGVFRELHRPFENLEVAREIPFENVWLNYDDLLTLEADEKPYYHPKLKKDIPVSEVLDGYARPEEKDKQGDQLDRIERKLGAVAEDTAYLKKLGIDQLGLLQKLSDDDPARETLFANIQKGLDELSLKLPANDPILSEAKKFKTEPEVKQKIKLAFHLLFLTLETEINWDMKEVFRQIVQDIKEGHIFTKPN
ncbi:MAG: COR domain-containing protein [Saprospiraceae bacterium]